MFICICMRTYFYRFMDMGVVRGCERGEKVEGLVVRLRGFRGWDAGDGDGDGVRDGWMDGYVGGVLLLVGVRRWGVRGARRAGVRGKEVGRGGSWGMGFWGMGVCGMDGLCWRGYYELERELHGGHGA